MPEFLVLPEAFLRYVATHKRIPLPIDAPLDSLQSVIETVYLEFCFGEGGHRGERDRREPAAPAGM